MTNKAKLFLGHSGCKLSIININDGRVVVRKASCSLEYNKRLRMQCAKQKYFNIYNKTNIKAPKVLAIGSDDNKFYFDMEFIHCYTLAEMLPFCSVESLMDKLFTHINIIKKERNINANKIFQKKVDMLINNNETNLLKNDAYKLLKSYDFNNVENSICHGDLTLENILVTYDYNIYLIDFLDSFYNSYLIDVAKLFQDLELGWSYRNVEANTTREVKLLIAKEYLVNKIAKMKNGEELLLTVYHILLLNVLRIYPYTKDKNTLDFLNNSCEKIIKIIGDMK